MSSPLFGRGLDGKKKRKKEEEKKHTCLSITLENNVFSPLCLCLSVSVSLCLSVSVSVSLSLCPGHFALQHYCELYLNIKPRSFALRVFGSLCTTFCLCLCVCVSFFNPLSACVSLILSLFLSSDVEIKVP